MSEVSALRGSAEPLVAAYDVALLDLDGVVYLARQPVPHAAEALASARAAGMRLAFVTNNASRPPETVAAHLTELGVDATTDDVVTSAQAAARLLRERFPAGTSVLVVGGEGLRTALAERELVAVDTADDDPAAVVQGYTPDTGWRELAEAALAIRHGAWWVATNLDSTLPSPRGLLPGNGALVAAVATATGATPVAAGKPDPPLHLEAVRRSGARRPLVVGDRLDTDIEGAVRAGSDSLLVLTGVSDAAELLAAAPERRPTYVAADLRGLLRPAPQVTAPRPGLGRCGAWTAYREGDGLRLERAAPTTDVGDDAAGSDGAPEDGLDSLRAATAAAWSAPGDGAITRLTGIQPDGWSLQGGS